MKGADPQPARISAEELGDTRAHFAGSLVGEGDREDPLRGDAVLRDQMCDPGRQYARLARSSAREHKQRSSGVFARLALGGIERERQRHETLSGNSNTNTEPLPSPGRNDTRPPCCCSTMRRANAKPIPQPPVLVDTPGSNSCRCISAPTPGPSSRTVTRPTAVVPSTSSSIRPPRPLNASTAFLTMTSSAHSMSTGSPVAIGPALDDVSVIVT